MEINQNKNELHLYPIKSNDYLGSICVKGSVFSNSIQTVVLLDSSASMRDETARFVREILPLVMSKLNWNKGLDLISFASKASWQYLTPKDLMKISINSAGITNIAPAIRMLRLCLESIQQNYADQPIRILTISSGVISDRESAEEETKKLIDFLATTGMSINSQGVRLITSLTEPPDTKALCYLLQINNISVTDLCDIRATESNEAIAGTIAALFQSDGFGNCQIFQVEKPLILKCPWNSHGSMRTLLSPGWNIFWLKLAPSGVVKLGNDHVKVIVQSQLSLAKFHQLIMETKMTYISDHVAILKIVDTGDAHRSFGEILSYFHRTEDALANKYSTPSNTIIYNLLDSIAMSKTIANDSVEMAEFLRNTKKETEVLIRKAQELRTKEKHMQQDTEAARTYREEQERLKQEEEVHLKREEEERLQRERLNREKEEHQKREETDQGHFRLKPEDHFKRDEKERALREGEERRKREEEKRRQRVDAEAEQKRIRRAQEARLIQEERECLQREEARLMQEERERLQREEDARLKREEEERLKREEEERLKREEEERLQREEEERLQRERLNREKEEHQKREETDQGHFRLKPEDHFKRDEKEHALREGEERRKREEEKRRQRVEADQERIRRAEEARLMQEERERLQREEEARLKREEEARLKREEEERLQREEEARLKRVEEERLKREEERFNRQKEERQKRVEAEQERITREEKLYKQEKEEMDRIRRDEEERFKRVKAERERIRRKEQEELERIRREEEEDRARREEEHRVRREEERLRLNEEEKLRQQLKIVEENVHIQKNLEAGLLFEQVAKEKLKNLDSSDGVQHVNEKQEPSNGNRRTAMEIFGNVAERPNESRNKNSLITTATNKVRKITGAIRSSHTSDFNPKPIQTVFVLHENVSIAKAAKKSWRFSEKIVPLVFSKISNGNSQLVHLLTVVTDKTPVVQMLQSILQTLDANKPIRILVLTNVNAQQRKSFYNFADTLIKFLNGSNFSFEFQVIRMASERLQNVLGIEKYRLVDIDSRKSNAVIATQIVELFHANGFKKYGKASHQMVSGETKAPSTDVVSLDVNVKQPENVRSSNCEFCQGNNRKHRRGYYVIYLLIFAIPITLLLFDILIYSVNMFKIV